MKAKDVWVGHEYAYVPGGYRRRGNNPLPMNARHVEIISLREQRITYNSSRMRTIAKVKYLGDEVRSWYGHEDEVVIGHLIDFWDNYESERDDIKFEQEERNRKIQEENAERQRKVAAINAEKKRVEEELLDKFAERTGYPRANLILDYNGDIKLRRRSVELWLGLREPLENSHTMDSHVSR